MTFEYIRTKDNSYIVRDRESKQPWCLCHIEDKAKIIVNALNHVPNPESK